VTFEKLDLSFVAFRGGHRIKRAQITALARCRIYFPRVKAIFARFEFANHKIFGKLKMEGEIVLI
jgi:hypothetical protein